MPSSSHVHHTTADHNTGEAAHGEHHMKQFNQEYDQYRHFLVDKGPRDPCSAPQAVMDSLDKHLAVLKSMETTNTNTTHTPRLCLFLESCSQVLHKVANLLFQTGGRPKSIHTPPCNVAAGLSPSATVFLERIVSRVDIANVPRSRREDTMQMEGTRVVAFYLYISVTPHRLFRIDLQTVPIQPSLGLPRPHPHRDSIHAPLRVVDSEFRIVPVCATSEHVIVQPDVGRNGGVRGPAHTEDQPAITRRRLTHTQLTTWAHHRPFPRLCSKENKMQATTVKGQADLHGRSLHDGASTAAVRSSGQQGSGLQSTGRTTLLPGTGP